MAATPARASPIKELHGRNAAGHANARRRLASDTVARCADSVCNSVISSGGRLISW